MTEVEEYFPRGGAKAPVTQFKQHVNFLGAVAKGEKKKRKPKKQLDPDDDGYLSDEARKDADKSITYCASGLSYSSVKPGVTILGRVKHVYDTKVLVSLPSKMQGLVMACHISEAYNKMLEAYVNDQTDKVRDLSSIFKPGQYVAASVLEADGDKLMLSMMPQHVYADKVHSDLKKGCLIQAAVSSVEDHGYVMDIGIKGVRAFLPKDQIEEGVELDTGVLTWCSVKSVTSSPETSIVTLSSRVEAVSKARVKHKPRNINQLAPGSLVEFCVEKSLENGIEGMVFNDVTAYIQRYHAGKVKGKKPGYGQKIQARVLYVMPTRLTPFLTMKEVFHTPDLSEEQLLKEGEIIEEAQVIKITGRSLHLRLRDGCAGTMSLRRVAVHEDLADEEVVARTYPVGSTHKVRVLSYNLSDFTYSVSDEPSLLSERYFSAAELSPGDVVSATVTAERDGGVAVNVGRVKGFVPHAHMYDSGVFVDPKKASTRKVLKKYTVGQKVRGRVLSVDLSRGSVVLTLKKSLLNPELEVLSSYEEAKVGKAYTGVIKHVRDYVVVSFFGRVCAYVRRDYVTKEPLEQLAAAFHAGQIVNCTILTVDPEKKKMTGSLTTPPFWPQKKREPSKHKQTTDDNDAPNKKRKLNETDINKKDKHKDDTKKNKKDRNKKNSVSEDDEEDRSKKKGKDKKQEVSEESDAIETDIYDDSDQMLTADDLLLTDLSDCATPKQYKKRVVSLLKAIKNKTMKIDKIDQKIDAIEDRGINPHNQLYHRAMRADKLVMEERIKKLLEVLEIAQNKLKELGVSKNEEYKENQTSKKRKKDIKDKNSTEKGDNNKKEVKENNKVEKKIKKKEVKVVESLEPVLEVPSAKDFWSAGVDSLVKKVEEEPSSSDEEETEQPKKKRKKLTVAEKVAKAREEEERVREMEKRAAESESQPRSSEQFERALLANPDCSQLWIAYMAFHLQAAELGKARAVCRKALAAISFREAVERLNVWLALLNTEHRFGTKETQQKTLEEALQMNDPYQVHSKLLDILTDTGKAQEVSSLAELMLRKYKRERGVYAVVGGACYKAGLVEKARQVMQKAVSVLEKKEHVSVLVQFALLERSAGHRERSEALFEQVLAVYPQRVDVASVYVDSLVKAKDVEQARQVLDRMTSQKLPARKMKILYRKWIEMEEKHGDPAQVDKVRQRAVEFIDKAQF